MQIYGHNGSLLGANQQGGECDSVVTPNIQIIEWFLYRLLDMVALATTE